MAKVVSVVLSADESGEVDVVLIDEITGVCVSGTNITWFDFDEEELQCEERQDELDCVYEEWLGWAREGEEGFAIV